MNSFTGFSLCFASCFFFFFLVSLPPACFSLRFYLLRFLLLARCCPHPHGTACYQFPFRLLLQSPPAPFENLPPPFFVSFPPLLLQTTNSSSSPPFSSLSFLSLTSPCASPPASSFFFWFRFLLPH